MVIERLLCGYFQVSNGDCETTVSHRLGNLKRCPACSPWHGHQKVWLNRSYGPNISVNIQIHIYILVVFLYFLTYPCKVLVIFTSFAYTVNESLWKQQMEHLSMAWRNGMYVWVLHRYSGSSPKHERVDPVSKRSRIQGMTQKSERKQQKKLLYFV